MAKTKQPRIEWAIFCEHAERDGLGFLNLTKVHRTVPLLKSDNLGVPMFLVFAVSGEPGSKFPITLAMVWPSGKRVPNTVNLQLSNNGYLEVVVNMTPLLTNELGQLRAEFRFAERSPAPNHVATLLIVDAPFSVPANAPPGSAPSH